MFERFRVLIVAGVTVGVLVVGVGSRLAMLVLRLTSPDSVIGVTGDDGFTIGRFTLGGTYNLLLLGAMVGIVVRRRIGRSLPGCWARPGFGADRVASADSWTKVGRRRWALPLVLIAGFPPVLVIAGPACT